MRLDELKIKTKSSILLFIYKIILEFSYINYVHPTHGYEGFILNFNIIKMFESYMATLIIILFLPLSEKKPSSLAIKILYIIMITPILSIYYLKSESRIYFYGVVFAFLITIISIKFRIIKLSNYKMKLDKWINFGLLFNTIAVYGGMIYFNGLPNLKLLDLMQVYIIRATINYGFNFMKYLVAWQGVIINPYLIIYNLEKSNIKLSIFFTILQITLYLITGNRAFFLYPVVIIALFYFTKKRSIINMLIKSTIIGLIISLIAFHYKITRWLASLFIYRALFLPAQISFQYYDYFSKNGFVKLSHSVFKRFFRTPVYDNNPVLIIGEVFYKNNHPNTGYLGDAYMNFGIPGMLIFSVLLGIILKLLDDLSNNGHKRTISKAFVFILMVSLSNMGLLTVLMNGGMGLYLLIMFLSLDKECEMR